jgi:hypothetical protein
LLVKATILFLKAVKVLLGSLRWHVQGVKDLEEAKRVPLEVVRVDLE